MAIRHQQEKKSEGEHSSLVNPDRKGIDQIGPVEGSRVSCTECIAFGTPTFAVSGISLFVGVYLLPFYARKGVTLSTQAFVVAAVRSIDVIADPIMAIISDNTHSRWGRRKPYFVSGCIPWAVAFFGLVSPPPNSVAWFAFFYSAFYLTNTFTTIPYYALGQEVTTDPDERRKLFAANNLFMLAGLMLGGILPAALGLQSAGGVFSIWAAVSMFAASCVLRERPFDLPSNFVDPQFEPSQLDKILPGFWSMLANQPFRTMILPWVLDTTCDSLQNSLALIWIQYVVSPEEAYSRTPALKGFFCQSDNIMSVALVGMMLVGALGTPIWFSLAARIGDYKAWLAFNFVKCSNILLLFPSSSWHSRKALLTCAVVFPTLTGLPWGASFLKDNMVGIIINYDELRTGKRSEALFTMFTAFVPKLVSVPSSMLPLTVLAGLGFVLPLEHEGEQVLRAQPPQVVWGLRCMFGILPCALSLLSVFLKWAWFPFKDVQVANAAIKSGLLSKREGLGYLDPVSKAHVPPRPSLKPEWARPGYLLGHFQGTAILRTMHAETEECRGQSLFSLARKQRALALVATLVFAEFSWLTARSWQWLLTPSLQWIPSALVLCFGVSVLGLIVTQLRMRAARELQGMPLPDALLEDLLEQRSQCLWPEEAPGATHEQQRVCSKPPQMQRENSGIEMQSVAFGRPAVS